MEEFIELIINILDQFLLPQQTLYDHLTFNAPSSELAFFFISCLGAILIIIGFIHFLIELKASLVIETILALQPLMGFLVIAVMVVIFFTFWFHQDESVELLTSALTFYIVMALIVTKFSLAIGGYKLGIWSGLNVYKAFIAILFSVPLLFICNQSRVLALGVSMLLLILLSREAYQFTIQVANNYPIAIGLSILAIVGGIFEPQYDRAPNIELLIILLLFLKYIFILSYLAGILRSLIAIFRQEQIE